MGTMLIAREVPAAGGDTLFANQYLAYESLPPRMREVLGKLTAVNSSAKADVTRSREDRLKTDGREDARQDYTAEHPVVRTHPETGRKALYVNAGHTVRFKNMTEGESAPLLEFLYAHQIRPEFTCRFTWSAGRSRSGTTARRSTTPSTTTTATAASCTASLSRAMCPGDVNGHEAQHRAVPHDPHRQPAAAGGSRCA